MLRRSWPRLGRCTAILPNTIVDICETSDYPGDVVLGARGRGGITSTACFRCALDTRSGLGWSHRQYVSEARRAYWSLLPERSMDLNIHASRLSFNP